MGYQPTRSLLGVALLAATAAYLSRLAVAWFRRWLRGHQAFGVFTRRLPEG